MISILNHTSALAGIAARQNTAVHTHGACRIMWGGGRSYPNNANDM